VISSFAQGAIKTQERTQGRADFSVVPAALVLVARISTVLAAEKQSDANPMLLRSKPPYRGTAEGFLSVQRVLVRSRQPHVEKSNNLRTDTR